jgi:hypothetical protein
VFLVEVKSALELAEAAPDAGDHHVTNGEFNDGVGGVNLPAQLR